MTNSNISQSEIGEMDKQIALLKERARNSEAQAKEGIEKQLRALEDQFEVIKAQLGKSEAQARAASSEVKTGVMEAWSKLKDSVESASKHIH